MNIITLPHSDRRIATPQNLTRCDPSCIQTNNHYEPHSFDLHGLIWCLMDGPVKYHQKLSGIVFHPPFHACMYVIHGINPFHLIFLWHSDVSLVGNVIECLFEEIKVLLLRDQNETYELHEINNTLNCNYMKRTLTTRCPFSSRTRKSPFSNPEEMVAIDIGVTLGSYPLDEGAIGWDISLSMFLLWSTSANWFILCLVKLLLPVCFQSRVVILHEKT